MTYPVTTSIKHLTYEKLFGDIQKGNLIIPISCLNEIETIDYLISDIIKNFDSAEAVSYSSFLNAIIQTLDIDESLKLGLEEIKNIKLTNKSFNVGVLFFRDNLLYFISQIIIKDGSGNLSVTGPENAHNSRDYYKSLLLISSKLNRSLINEKETVLKDCIIREYPYYYFPETSLNIYTRRIQRYSYTYNHILKNLDAQSKSNICNGIKILEEKTQISLDDYILILKKILNWFDIPLSKEHSNRKELESLGFNY